MSNSIKAQTLKGFRDFLPEEAILRKKVIEKITQVFERFGYDPLETPALEYAETLLGKYGEDADKLLYLFEDRGQRKVGMRYDQTVPVSRVVSQYQDLPKPFKRYQIQPVWRAENTQKGRYREFLQCDADIIGDSNKPIADAEILALMWNIYQELGFENIVIQVNSRPILRQLISDVEENEFLSIVRSLDKLDKVGREAVMLELRTKGQSDETIERIFERIDDWTLDMPDEDSPAFKDLDESITIAMDGFGLPKEALKFNPTLARGLDYYTGIIFEAVLPDVKGSLGGGGRYDNLIKQFTGQEMSAVGFAIGFDRTIEAATELGLIKSPKTVTQVLVVYQDNGKDVFPTALNLITKLRAANKNAELFLDPSKDMSKQMKYADKKGIPYVVIVGEQEIAANKFQLKNLQTGEQSGVTSEELISRV